MRRPSSATRFHQLFFALLLFDAAILSLSADPIGDLKQSLSSNDPAVRGQAVSKFVMSLGTVNGEALMIPSIPVLVDALSDSDDTVRKYAISGLRGILFVHSPVLYSSSKLTIDPSTEEALLKATSDSDPEVRELALETYAVTYKLTPDLENEIIAEFKSPQSGLPHQEDVRLALMESLMLSHSPSAHAVDFLTGLLSDSKWAPLIASSMAADNCPLPGNALPKLVTLLAQDKDTVNRAAYAGAIGSYGKQAQSYRPQLETALTNETDDVTKQNIQHALNRIQ